MKPLVAGQQTGLVEIPANWYIDDLPPMMFIKSAPNSHGFVNARDIEDTWRDHFDYFYREYDEFVFVSYDSCAFFAPLASQFCLTCQTADHYPSGRIGPTTCSSNARKVGIHIITAVILHKASTEIFADLLNTSRSTKAWSLLLWSKWRMSSEKRILRQKGL